MKRIRSSLTYANVIATLALILAVGGASAFAAGQLGKNTVGSKQLKKNAVTAAKIKNGAVTDAKIKNGAISGAKINLGTLGTVPSAANANTLGGIGPSAFSRVVRSAIDDNALVGEDGTARQVNINAPQSGFILVIASADVFGEENGAYSCALVVDGNELDETVRTSELSEFGNEEENCETNTVQPVSAGTHNVKFNFFIGPEIVVDETELDVVFIPFAG